MFMIEELDDVPRELGSVYAIRLRHDPAPQTLQVRAPVGLFLVREDGSNGSVLAEEVVGSFGYWHERSGQFFDGVFLGWGFDAGTPVFGEQQFTRCVHDLEDRINWRYRGGAHLILTDFVYDVRLRKGDLDFSRTVPLDISDLLDRQKLTQLSTLIEDMIAPVRERRGANNETSVWDISDYIGVLRARRALWQRLVERFGLLLGWADDVAPFAVRDLRKDKSGGQRSEAETFLNDA